MSVGLGQLKLADQKGRRLPAGQPHAQILDEPLQVGLALFVSRHLNDRSKRIDDDDRGRRGLHFLNDALQHLVEPAVQRLLRQVDEPHRRIHLRHVEELELLLIAQHLERRLAEDGEEQGRPFGSRQREHDLLHERGLAGSGCPRDEIERELRNAAAQDGIEPGNARRQATNGNLRGHLVVSSVVLPAKSSGHVLRKRLVVKPSPMKDDSNSTADVSMAIARSLATADS